MKNMNNVLETMEIEDFTEEYIRNKIDELDSIEIESYQKEFENKGFIFLNGSFEDNEKERIIYFELSKNEEEYVVFVYYSKINLEISEHYIVDKSKCKFSN